MYFAKPNPISSAGSSGSMPIATEEQEISKTIEDPPTNIGSSKDNIGPTSENQQENEGKTIPY